MDTNIIRQLASVPPPPKKFLSYHKAAAKIRALETQLGRAASAPILNIWRANERVSELENMVAARAKSVEPAMVAPVVAPVVEKFGRERWTASFAAAAKPKAKGHPELSGRSRFNAGGRINATAQNLKANPKPVDEGLTGHRRFKAAVVKDFGSK